MEKGLRDIAQRQVNAMNDFEEMLAEMFGLTSDEARKVFETFRIVKALNFDAVNGRYTVKNGAFLEPDVIARALAI